MFRTEEEVPEEKNLVDMLSKRGNSQRKNKCGNNKPEQEASTSSTDP